MITYEQRQELEKLSKGKCYAIEVKKGWRPNIPDDGFLVYYESFEYGWSKQRFLKTFDETKNFIKTI